MHRYEVEFSKPLANKPIPEGTVKVYFEIELFEDGSYEIRFHFENESLKHKLSNTMRKNMFEVSQNPHHHLIQQKIKLIFFLSTEMD